MIGFHGFGASVRMGSKGADLFLRWFLIPAVVVAAGVALVGFITIITTKARDPAELLSELRPGNSETRRWQAAFGLSALVASRREELGPGFSQQVTRYFEDATERDTVSDPRFQRFLALTLVALQERDAIPALVSALDREGDVQTRIFALKALSEFGAAEDNFDGAVIRALRDPEPAIRMMAAFTAGKLGGSWTIPQLQIALNDAVVEVRWNAALSLARMGNDSGQDLLALMVDRSYVRQVSNLTWEEEGAVVKNAIIGLANLKSIQYAHLLSRLVHEEEDLQVRSVAVEALRSLRRITPQSTRMSGGEG